MVRNPDFFALVAFNVKLDLALSLPAHSQMGRHKLFKEDAKTVRDQLNLAINLAMQIHEKERELILNLQQIDQKKFYVRYGLKSLSGFYQACLHYSKTQTHRIVTQVGRSRLPGDPRVGCAIPTDKIVE
jgi:hypothetical protein